MRDELHVVILAAGAGRRMHSARPKVLHRLGGRPLLRHVLDTAMRLRPRAVRVVYGHGGEAVKAACEQYAAKDSAKHPITLVRQARQEGTGHAVALALVGVPAAARAVVLYGDVPMLTAATVAALLELPQELAILSARPADPDGYGRVVKEGGRVVGIVEQKDAEPEQRRIGEVNSGVMAGAAGLMRELLDAVGRDNRQGERYLTDIVALARKRRIEVGCLTVADAAEVAGVNDGLQLAAMERRYQLAQARRLLEQGVLLLDPARFDARGELVCGRDVRIDINCVFNGAVTLGDGADIGPHCVIGDSTIGRGVQVRAYSLLEGAVVGDNAIIGPYARLRPGADLAERVHIGNFVEVKNSVIKPGSKVSHLSYIGDSELGGDVNIGAGTITCNYDGAAKHRTIIGDDVFIGSGCELVAPLTVGDGATIGAGSTISRDVAAGCLEISRAKQRSILGWRRPRKPDGAQKDRAKA